jgi:glutathione peroxidase
MILDHTFTDINGTTVSFRSLAEQNKFFIAVNVASECGNTPQYVQLQELHDKYSDKGLVIIGFPSNDFGSQEPGSNEDIKEFCSKEYNTTFLMSEKINILGEDAHPVYKHIHEATNMTTPWNFTKYLINNSGEVLSARDPQSNPLDMTDWIEAQINKIVITDDVK